MFCMGTFSIHATVIGQIDIFRKHCLWRGADINAKQSPKVAWTEVCKSKDNGGLGVLDLRTQNEALLLKHLHKFLNKEDIPWVLLIWESNYSNAHPQSKVKKASFWWRHLKTVG